jgi:site-specific recombinase XerD
MREYLYSRTYPRPPALPIPAPQLATWAGVQGAYAMPILPFQFPSLQHLDDRHARAVLHAESVDGLSRGSIQAYRYAYKRFRTFLHGHNRESAFVAGDIRTQVSLLEEWIGWMRVNATSHTTINTYWRNLRAVFARIAREDGCADPMAFVRTPQPGKRIPHFLTRDALESVFLFVRHYQWRGGRFEALRNLAILACMALAGLRLGEVLRLRVGEVDLNEQMIKIHRGKGRHGGKDRTAYMPDPLRFVMSEYLEERRRKGTSIPEVFVRATGTAPIGRITVRRLCDSVRLKTGIRIAPHMLRHTCATLLRQSGVADRLAMEQLGHSSLTVLQRYSHVANGELQEAMRTIDVDLGT